MQTMYMAVNAHQDIKFIKMGFFPDAKPIGIVMLIFFISILGLTIGWNTTSEEPLNWEDLLQRGYIVC